MDAPTLFFPCRAECDAAMHGAVIDWMRTNLPTSHSHYYPTTTAHNTLLADAAAAHTLPRPSSHDVWATRITPLTSKEGEEEEDAAGGGAQRGGAGATKRARSGLLGKTRRRPPRPPAVTHASGARYMRCSRRHAEIDLSLMGSEPLAVWHQCYMQCLALATHGGPAAAGPPFVLLLLHADRIPPALGSVIHGYRTNIWHRPDRPLQFAFVGRFLPCAALHASVVVVGAPAAAAAAASSSTPAPPMWRAPLQSLYRTLVNKKSEGGGGGGGGGGEQEEYPFYAVREELYRAQMFCTGLPEIVEGLVVDDDHDESAAAESVGATFLASASCRAEMGDWAARNRQVFHAEKLVYSFHQHQQQSAAAAAAAPSNPQP